MMTSSTAANAGASPNKPGWKTSEFWVTIATMAGMIANGAGYPVPVDTTTAAVGMVYTAVRGLIKAVKAWKMAVV